MFPAGTAREETQGRTVLKTNYLSDSFIEADEALDSLYWALEGKDPGVSVKETMDHLVSVYQGAEEATRYKVVTDLIDLEFSGSRSFLASVLRNDESALVRHEAAFGLGVLGKPTDRVHLEYAALRDNDDMIRHEAVIALGAIGGVENIPALEIALKSESPTVASSARFSIQSIELRDYQNTLAAGEAANA